VKEFVKTTIAGGALFLLPLGLVLFILGYALRLAKSAAQPISEALDLDRLGDLTGIGITTVVGVLLLVLVSLLLALLPARPLADGSRVGLRVRCSAHSRSTR
jgi:uncharacterized membrane protein